MGTCEIIVPNGSDDTKQSIYTLNISGRTYDGAFVWKTPYGNLYIATTDVTRTSWTENLTSTYCSGKSGATWVVPTVEDWRTMFSVSGSSQASDEISNYYKNNKIFASGTNYWSSSPSSDTNAYSCHFIGGYTGKTSIYNDGKASSYPIRCVSRP